MLNLLKIETRLSFRFCSGLPLSRFCSCRNTGVCAHFRLDLEYGLVQSSYKGIKYSCI